MRRFRQRHWRTAVRLLVLGALVSAVLLNVEFNSVPPDPPPPPPHGGLRDPPGHHAAAPSPPLHTASGILGGPAAAASPSPHPPPAAAATPSGTARPAALPSPSSAPSPLTVPAATVEAVVASPTASPSTPSYEGATLPSGKVTVRGLFDPALDATGLPPDELALHDLLAHPMAGCNASWVAHLEAYAAFHATHLAALRRKEKIAPKIVVWRCWELPDNVAGTSTDCGGLADRMSGMNHIFLLALYYQWFFLAEWQGQPATFDSPFIDYAFSPALVAGYHNNDIRAYHFTSCPNSGDYRDCPLAVANPHAFYETGVSYIATNRWVGAWCMTR